MHVDTVNTHVVSAIINVDQVNRQNMLLFASYILQATSVEDYAVEPTDDAIYCSILSLLILFL